MHRALLLASLATCAPQAASPGEKDPSPPTANAVLGVMQAHEGLTLQVSSGGCSKNADVSFAAIAGKLTIATLAQDRCEAEIPLGANLLFAWAELPTFGTLGFTLGPAPVLEPGKTPRATTAPAGAQDEPIYGVLVQADGLDVRVSSGGCTSAEQFVAWIEPAGSTELVHLVRTKQDMCEAFLPEGALLHFTWTQLGVTTGTARLVNPIEKLPLK